MTSDHEPPTDPPLPQEPEVGLCDEIEARARFFEREGRDSLVTEAWHFSRMAAPYEQRRINAEQQLATLRTRLETAEGALRAIGRLQSFALPHAQIRSETVAIVELALKPEEQSAMGEEEGGMT